MSSQNLGPRQLSTRGAPGGSGGGANSPLPQQRTNSMRGEREGGGGGGGGGGGSRRGGQQAPVLPPEDRYIVYLRLPFCRSGFVDPPQVDWDAAKERYLWKVLSRGNRNADLDWNALAAHLEVSRAFLLQQAAWLYERELSQIQAQMRRTVGGLSTNMSAPPSPGPQSPAAVVGGFPMVRTGTGGGEARAPSSLSLRSGATPTPRSAAMGLPTIVTSTIKAQPMSRSPSTATTISSPRPTAVTMLQPQLPPTQHRFSQPIPASQSPRPSSPSRSASEEEGEESMDPLSSSSSSSSSSASTSTKEATSNSILHNLPPPFPKKKSQPKTNQLASSSEDDEDEDAEPAFLPFSSSSSSSDNDEGSSSINRSDSISGTVTLPIRKISSGAAAAAASAATAAAAAKARPDTTSSMDEEGEEQPSSQTPRPTRGFRKPPPPPPSSQPPSQSSQKTAAAAVELGSPRRRPVSDSAGPSSPSMGSSFSDLSDTSVTQSAMEEAYLSQAGAGVASRMSSLSQAVRSRYFTAAGGGGGGGER